MMRSAQVLRTSTSTEEWHKDRNLFRFLICLYFQVLSGTNALARTHTVPYGLRAADDALDDVIPDLLPVIFVDVEGKDDFAQGRLPVLPVLTHHVLQVDGGYNTQELETNKTVKIQVYTQWIHLDFSRQKEWSYSREQDKISSFIRCDSTIFLQQSSSHVQKVSAK